MLTIPVLFMFVVLSGSGLSYLWPPGPVYADHSCPFCCAFRVRFLFDFLSCLFCVLSIVSCICLSFSFQSSRWPFLSSFFYLLSCPAPVFPVHNLLAVLSWLCIPPCLLPCSSYIVKFHPHLLFLIWSWLLLLIYFYQSCYSVLSSTLQTAPFLLN